MESDGLAGKVTEPKLTYEQFRDEAKLEGCTLVYEVTMRDGLGGLFDA